MKSEPVRFSPTSAGVRTEHLDLQNSHKSYMHKNYCNNNNSTNTSDTFSLPRVRTPKTHLEGEDLQNIIVQNRTDPKTERSNRKRNSHKMRNCMIVGVVTVIICLLSFVLFVECGSLKGNSRKSYNEEKEIAHESRVQEATLQPDEDSRGEVSTENSKDLLSSTQRHPSRKRVVISTGEGRLTRKYVSVICKSGHGNNGHETTTSTKSTLTSPSPTTKSERRKLDKELELPTYLPRETDWDDDDDAAEEIGLEDAAFSSEESKQVVTVSSGYSHTTGGKPKIQSLKHSGSSTIKYIQKPPKGHSAQESDNAATKKLNEDDLEGSSSSEESVVITVKPKSKSSHHKSRPKTSSINHSSHSVSIETNAPSSTQQKSSRSNHNSKKEKRQRKRDHSSEENEEEKEEEVAHRSSRRTKTSKRSENEQAKQSSANNDRNEKGDSGEIEEDSLFPALRKSKTESKRDKKVSERRQKPPVVVPVTDPELESAEAEPVAVIEVRKSEKSSRSRSTTSGRGSDYKKEASSLKPVAVVDDSSEEYNMEEMPFSTPHENKNSKRGKSRRSSSSQSSSSSSRRMSSKTAAPKLRTRAFSSVEGGD